MNPQERPVILPGITGRTPQGTLAWDPEYAEYLHWLAVSIEEPARPP